MEFSMNDMYLGRSNVLSTLEYTLPSEDEQNKLNNDGQGTIITAEHRWNLGKVFLGGVLLLVVLHFIGTV